MANINLGNISISLSANLSRFNKSIDVAIKKLEKFSTVVKPLSTSLRAMDTSRASQGMRNLSNTTAEMAAKGYKGSAAVKELSLSMTRQQRALQKAIGPTVQVGVAYKQMGAAGIRAMTTLKHSTVRTLGSTIKEMLTFRAFMGKIIHYVTFSIGVQMVMGIRRGMEQLVETFSDFERSITNAVTISGYLGAAFEEVKEHIMDVSRELGRTTVYSAVAVAKSFYSLASAGYDISKMVAKDLLPMLDYAAATQTDLDEATKAVLVTLKQYRLDMDEATRIVDVFTTSITTSFQTMEKLKEGMKYAGPMAGVLGVSLEETVAALTALVDRGYEGSQAGQRLNMIFTKLLKPTDQAKEMLEGLGLSAADLDPKVHSLVEILFKLRGAGFGAAEAAMMFRARTAGASAVIVENADAVARMVQRYEMADGITRSVAEVQEETLWGALTKTANRMIEMATVVGEKLAPIIRYLADIIQKSLAPFLELLGGALTLVIQNAGLLKGIMIVLISTLALYIVKVKILDKWHRLWEWGVRMVVAAKHALTVATLAASNAMGVYNAAMAAGVGRAAALTVALHSLKVAFWGTPLGWFTLAVGAATTALIAFSLASSKLPDDFRKTTMELAVTAGRMNLVERASINLGDSFIDLAKFIGILAKNEEEYSEELQRLRRESELGEQRFAEYIEQAKMGKPVIIDLIRDNVRFRRSLKSIKEGLGVGAESARILTEATLELSGEYIVYTKATGEVIDANLEVIRTEKSLDVALEEQSDNLDLINQLTEEHIDAIDRAKVSEREWMGAIGNILTSMRQFDDELSEGTLDEWIGSLEDAAEAQVILSQKEEDALKIEEERRDVVLEMSRAISQYGTDSKEVDAIQSRLNSTIRSSISLENEISDIRSDLLYKEELYNAVIGNTITKDKQLSKAERDLLEDAKLLIDMREDYIRAQTEMIILESEQEALSYAREHHLTIMEEKLRIFLEAQQKVFEIEEKLYKLRVSEDEQLDDLFQKLAEQGVLTKEMIDAYTEMMKAQGEVASLTYDFVNVYENLSDAQRDVVDAFLAGEASIGDLEAAGITGISTIVAYYNAQTRLSDAVSNFGDIMGPLIDQLMDLNVISAEVAGAYYDWIDNANEVAQANFNLLSSQNAINDTMEGLIRNTILLASSLMGYEDNAEDLRGIYPELLSQMGIQQDALSFLNDLYGLGTESLSDYTDEQLYVGATLLKAAKSLGIWEEGMSAVNIANALGFDSLNDLNNMATINMGTMESYAEIAEALADASLVFKDATDDLVGALDKLRVFMGLGEDAMRDYALRFDFADTVVKGFEGDVTKLWAYMQSRGWDWDMSVMSEWDGNDWNTFISGLGTKKEAFITAIEKMTGKTNIEEEWNGEDWSTFHTQFKGKLQELINDIADISPVIVVETEFPKPKKPEWWETLFNIVSSVIPKIIWPFEEGGIVEASKGLITAQRGTILRSPTPVLAGEAGDEAFIPLEGANRKYGKELLDYIIPHYYPEMMAMQRGGIAGGTTTYGGDTYGDAFTVTGPIYVQAQNPQDFTEQLKRKYRASSRR